MRNQHTSCTRFSEPTRTVEQYARPSHVLHAELVARVVRHNPSHYARKVHDSDGIERHGCVDPVHQRKELDVEEWVVCADTEEEAAGEDERVREVDEREDGRLAFSAIARGRRGCSGWRRWADKEVTDDEAEECNERGDTNGPSKAM